MSAPFAVRAEEAMQDAGLGEVTRRVAGLLDGRRREATGALEGFEGLRQRARAAKFGVLGALDEKLKAFEARILANGGHVHWARDGDEANAIILGILRSKDAKRVVKSKSMVTEEIELNHALERDGLVVVETDLGEYVAQLRKEKPSHIILPIIHLNRAQVAQAFRDKAGVEVAAEVPELVEKARQILRSDFEAADAGITGANFGVAGEGALCIVSNEGNARLTMSLPKLHIAVLGVEKLVSDMEELSVFLRLLARSATGQRLTVYTNLLWPGRQAGDGAGAQETHVVLLDNGRSSLLNSPAFEILACIRCGACLNACPIYRHAGGHAYGATYPGPMGSLLSPALGTKEGRDLAFASSLCGACRDACPVGIDIPRMLLHYRSGSSFTSRSGGAKRLAFWLFGALASRPWLYRAVLGAGRLLAGGEGWLRGAWLPGGWTRHRSLKRPAKRSFLEQWQGRA